MNKELRHYRAKNPEAAKEVADFLETYLLRALEEYSKSCLSCENFNDEKELCNLNYQRPPARVIAFGCECFEDKVPF